jgi:hypothetical protein
MRARLSLGRLSCRASSSASAFFERTALLHDLLEVIDHSVGIPSRAFVIAVWRASAAADGSSRKQLWRERVAPQRGS